MKKALPENKLLIEQVIDNLKLEDETFYGINHQKTEELKLPPVMLTRKVIRWSGEFWDIAGEKSKEDTLIPPLSGYTKNQGKNDLRVSYVRLNNKSELVE